MNIFINARFLTQSITGVQRYAIEIVKALDSLIDRGVIDLGQVSFTLLAPRDTGYKLTLKHIALKQVGHLKGHLWEQIELPLYARNGLLISFCNAAPLLKCNQIVTIHDAAVFAFPEAYSLAFRIWYQVLLPALGWIAKRIITVSFFSKKELSRRCHIDKSKIQVIYAGKEHMLSPVPDKTILDIHELCHKSFILAVGSRNLNKNFRSIVRAIELLSNVNFDIVIAGGANPRIFSQSKKPLPEHVKYLGYMSDGQLRVLYGNAACFIYPSFYEGFGFPPLEAMACGCPVIVSNTGPLSEVCGDAALYCDPHSPTDIANKIQQLMKDPSLQKELHQKGLERAKHFTWEKCAREIFELID